jgi:hypothetical protein
MHVLPLSFAARLLRMTHVAQLPCNASNLANFSWPLGKVT